MTRTRDALRTVRRVALAKARNALAGAERERDVTEAELASRLAEREALSAADVDLRSGDTLTAAAVRTQLATRARRSEQRNAIETAVERAADAHERALAHVERRRDAVAKALRALAVVEEDGPT